MSKLSELAASIVAQAKQDQAGGNARPLDVLADVLITQNASKVRILGLMDLREMVAEGIAPPKKVEVPKKANK